MDWHGQNKVSNDTEYFQTVKPPFWKLGEAITTSHVTTNRNRKYIPEKFHNTPRGSWVDRLFVPDVALCDGKRDEWSAGIPNRRTRDFQSRKSSTIRGTLNPFSAVSSACSQVSYILALISSI